MRWRWGLAIGRLGEWEIDDRGGDGLWKVIV